MPLASQPSGRLQKTEIRPGRSSNNGCLIAVVASIVIAGVFACVGGYWAVMHSSLPLKPFEAAINESGKAKITGLKGSLSTGMSADELRIFDTGAGDTWFTDIVFRFNGIADISSHNRVIVEELSVKTANISLPLESDEDGNDMVDLDINLGDDENGTTVEFESSGSGDLGDVISFELKTLRIDELIVANGRGETNRGSLLLSGFKAAGENVSLDDLQITGDFLEVSLDQLPASNRFAQVVTGKVKTALHKAILRDIDFRVEFGGAGNGDDARISAFAGAMNYEPGPDSDTGLLTISNLTLSNYLDSAVADFPTAVDFRVSKTSGDGDTRLEGGRFQIGRTTFFLEVQKIASDDDDQELIAKATVSDREITLHIAEPKEGGHYVYRFSSNVEDEADLASLVLFETGHAELNDKQWALLKLFKRRHQPDETKTDSGSSGDDR